MPGQLVEVLIPPVVGLPRAAGWTAEAAAWTIRMQAKSLLTRTGSAIWTGLERVGRSRARPELMAFASRCEALQPELAKELRAFASRAD